MEEYANKNTYKRYLYFWSGQLFSLLGSLVIFFAIFVWITDITGSAVMLSLANFFYMIPMLIVIPIAGVLTDRYDRKKIILIVDSMQAFLTVILTIFFISGFTNIWLVFIFIGLRSIFQGFHMPAVSAIIPVMVPKDKLGKINGINYLFTGFIQLVGPVVGATLLFFFAIEYILWVDVITFLIALVPLLLIEIPNVHINSENGEKSSFTKEMKEGFIILKAFPGLITILILAMLLNFLIQPLTVLMPYYIKIVHGGNNFVLAILEMILQGGMIIGALIPSFKKQWKNKVRSMFIGIIVVNIGYMLYAITPLGFYYTMGAGAFIIGFVLPIVNTILLTVVQTKIPPDKMGRVSSILNTLSMVISPIGAIISGPLSVIFGIAPLYLYCAILGIIITITTYYLTGIRHIDFDKEIDLNNSKKNETEQNNKKV